MALYASKRDLDSLRDPVMVMDNAVLPYQGEHAKETVLQASVTSPQLSDYI